MSSTIDRNNLMFTKRYLVLLIIPLVVEVLLSVAVGMADTMMVSQAGEAAVAGVSAINSVQNLCVFLFQAFATGGAVVSSQYLGKGDKDKACFSAKQLMNISITVSLTISIIVFILKEQTVNLIYGTLEEDVYASAILYFIPILISLPFLSIQNAANALCRTMGKSTITMVVSLIVNLVNVVGNAIFLFVFNLGALGVGIASLISRIVGAVIMFIVVCDKKKMIYVQEPLKINFDLKMIGKILEIALPSGFENAIFHIGKILVASLIASLGTASIAANAVLDNIGTFNNIPGSAIGMASITIIGQCCGARAYDQANYYARKLISIAYVAMASLSLILYLLLPSLVSIYNLPAETTALCIRVISLNLLQSALFWPLSFTLPNFLRAAGDVKYTMIVAIASMWICRVILSRIFAVNLGMGLQGVYWGMYVDWYCRVAFFVLRFLSGKWKTKTVV